MDLLNYETSARFAWVLDIRGYYENNSYALQYYTSAVSVLEF